MSVSYLAAASVDDSTLGTQELTAAADGSLYKKVALTLMFSGALSIIGWRKILSSISIPYMLALLWFLASVFWAVDPAISIRRWLSLLMTLATVTACLGALGTKDSLKVTYSFLAAVLVLSLTSVFLAYLKIGIFAFAIHPTDETDPSLIGAWRGITLHKNVAGAVITHASVLFLHFFINRRKARDLVLFLAAIVFLIGTRSKTSMALDVIVLTLSLIYRWCSIRRGGMHLFLIGFLTILFSSLIIAIISYDQLAIFFSNPDSLSGRVAIWNSLLGYLNSHWMLGAGYGSFWAIGFSSPIFQYAQRAFILTIGHSHSGYFEILVTGGVFGLAFSLSALILWPFYRFMTVDVADGRVYSVCFGMWCFGVLQNFTESQFFAPDKQSWLFILIAITLVNHIGVARRRVVAETISDSGNEYR